MTFRSIPSLYQRENYSKVHDFKQTHIGPATCLQLLASQWFKFTLLNASEERHFKQNRRRSQGRFWWDDQEMVKVGVGHFAVDRIK